MAMKRLVESKSATLRGGATTLAVMLVMGLGLVAPVFGQMGGGATGISIGVVLPISGSVE